MRADLIDRVSFLCLLDLALSIEKFLSHRRIPRLPGPNYDGYIRMPQ